MPTAIDFYFDFISPYSYLASIELGRLAGAHGRAIAYHPIVLIDLMKQVGNRPTTLECANKGAYVTADLQRWARRYEITLAFNPAWREIDFAELGRGALAAIADGRGAAYVDAVFAAVWRDAVDLSSRARLIAALDAAGLDGAGLLARAPGHAAELAAATSAAATRGVFGSPTMFVGDEMFFGNDRFEFVARALAA